MARRLCISGVAIAIAVASPSCKRDEPASMERLPAVPAPAEAFLSPAPAARARSFFPSIRMAGTTASGQLLRGFHAAEGDWRWTEPEFALVLGVPAAVTGSARVRLDFDLPAAVLAQRPRVTLRARAGGASVTREYSTEGPQSLELDLGASDLSAGGVTVEYSVDAAFVPAGADSRRLGVIAVAAELTPR